MSRDKSGKATQARKKEIEEAKIEEKPQSERFGNPKDVPVKEPL